MGEYVDSFQGMNGVQITLTRPLLDRRYTPPPQRRRNSKTRSSSNHAISAQPSFAASSGPTTINLPAGSTLPANPNHPVLSTQNLSHVRGDHDPQSPHQSPDARVGSPSRLSLDHPQPRSDRPDRRRSSHHRRSGTDRSAESVRHHSRRSLERPPISSTAPDRRRAASRNKSRESIASAPTRRSRTSTAADRRMPSRTWTAKKTNK